MRDYLVIDNFFSKEFCQDLINISEQKGYDEADISYNTGAKMNKEYRDNYRCLYRDEDLRQEIENKLIDLIPKSVNIIGEGGTLIKKDFLKVSGNFRFYKYLPGQKFKKHRDSNQLEEGGVSLTTILIYLNTAEEGGETAIYIPELGDRLLVKAEEGKILLFDHSIAHTGEELKKGVKYLLRTDLIYAL